VVTDLVNNTIPGKPGIINDDMDLATAELGSALHEFIYVVRVEDVAHDG